MGVMNFLVDGVSGTGKTAVCLELRRRGFPAVNGDRELAYQGDPRTGAAVDGLSGLDVHAHHLWNAELVRQRAADRSEPATFFCGGSRNVGAFLDLFDEVFVLTVDAATLDDRLDARAGDEWAGRGRTAERALVRQLHTSGADTPPGTPIDATRPLSAVVDEVLRRCGLLGA